MENPETGGPAALTGTSPAATEPEVARSSSHVDVDDSEAVSCYANFCRVTGTPEELVIDFGLNPQPTGMPTQPIPLTQRVVVNLFTAKRLAQVLQATLHRHESVFGAIETDVQKRVRRR